LTDALLINELVNLLPSTTKTSIIDTWLETYKAHFLSLFLIYGKLTFLFLILYIPKQNNYSDPTTFAAFLKFSQFLAEVFLSEL